MLTAMYRRDFRVKITILIAGLAIFAGCRVSSEPELFLIPENYEGVVVILFNQPNGQMRFIDNRRLYDIPPNGILATKFPKTTHGKLDQKYYYKNVNGDKKSEIQVYSFGPSDERKNYVMNGLYGNFTNNLDSNNTHNYPIDYAMFTIGKTKDKDSLQAVSGDVLRTIIYR
jgi:hypothetical protein